MFYSTITFFLSCWLRFGAVSSFSILNELESRNRSCCWHVTLLSRKVSILRGVCFKLWDWKGCNQWPFIQNKLANLSLFSSEAPHRAFNTPLFVIYSNAKENSFGSISESCNILKQAKRFIFLKKLTLSPLRIRFIWEYAQQKSLKTSRSW